MRGTNKQPLPISEISGGRGKQGLKYATSKCIIAAPVGEVKKGMSKIDEGAPAGAEGEEKRDTRRGFEATTIIGPLALESRP